MRVTVRKNVFETNSSSTHSIAISKNTPTEFPKSITFSKGEYGWECEEYSVPDYLYTAITESPHEGEYLEKLKQTLDKNGIEYSFDTDESWYPGIDHGYELEDFLEAVFSDEDLLLRCLFGEGTVYTGNDNAGYTEEDARGCLIAESEYWDSEKQTYVENPYHDGQNYDYFYKGN